MDHLPPARSPTRWCWAWCSGPRDAWVQDADTLVTRWTASERSNRVGMRLSGGRSSTSTPTVSCPARAPTAAAIQVPPSGEPVLFLADHPVTGGYPVVAVVVDADVDRAAQVRPGQCVRFSLGGGAVNVADVPPAEARAGFRGGLVTPTAGWSRGWTQANLLAVPRDLAFDFLLFAQRNPKPCPVLDVIDAGEVGGPLLDGDIRTDVPAYRVYVDGELVEETPDVTGRSGARTSCPSSSAAASPSRGRCSTRASPCGTSSGA